MICAPRMICARTYLEDGGARGCVAARLSTTMVPSCSFLKWTKVQKSLLLKGKMGGEADQVILVFSATVSKSSPHS
jgi:hypothetical protein